jgi:hypothetical protein
MGEQASEGRRRTPTESPSPMWIGVPAPESDSGERKPEHCSDDVANVDAHQRLTILRAMMYDKVSPKGIARTNVMSV